MAEPRRLRGHKATATCCIASRDRPGLLATAGEDGCVCWFDLRCKDAQLIMDVGEQPVSSLCFKPGNEHIVYVSSGSEVKCFDVHMPAYSWSGLKNYNYNKEEINQIACSSKAAFLGSTDDSGEIKIIDIHQHCLYKTLRAGHTSESNFPQFVPCFLHAVELLRYVAVYNLFLGNLGKVLKNCSSFITGGLDSKLVLWDFSKGRVLKIFDFGLLETNCSSTQCLNPAFIHAITIPDVDMLENSQKVCVVARGDGIVDVIDIESELAAVRSKSSTRARKGSQSTSKSCSSAAGDEIQNQNGRNSFHLDFSLGGHTAAVSCVAFSLFGERGKYLISGGNDKSLKIWDCSRYPDGGRTGSTNDVLRLNISLSRKINWLCTTPSESENLVVCDTTKVVKVYSVS